MPALPPPSMQIGGPEYGNIPAAFPGPEAFGGLQPGIAYTPATLIQQVSTATTVATPANLTVNVASTGVGNTLVALVAVAATGSSPGFSAPAGWIVQGGTLGNNAGNTLAGRFFVFPNNPGAITSVQFNITNANGIAIAFYEFDDNVVGGSMDTLYGFLGGGPGNASFSNGSTAPSVVSYTPSVGPVLLVGFECDVTGQAYTAANVGPGWIADTTATSTTGATLVVIRPFHTVTTPVGGQPYQIAGSLAGSIANGVIAASLTLASTGSIYGGNAASQWYGGAQAIGDGPCPKAGGAGGGY